ncbi:octicosapeptide/Phox/Bem1p family protein (chloroplast) [Artemisia annua]|uniref:Octicosapeptide/Phox/Bem1p family protein n=1 Tax=Artemisia annua TaxID=35608 RepID=A0A2U1QFV3_ARTAN|nr:octicosapeptide/Phox/Bem1p family protein [Artemisia annua]
MDTSTPRANPHAPPSKLRILCSFNGHILPRPYNKTLTYIGGDTRLITIPHPVTFQTLTKKILKTTSFNSNTTSFIMKYQLPFEDLDSLITVTSDEDLEHMIDEYNCIGDAKIRLFLFPRNSDSVEFVEAVKSVGSVLLEGSDKSNEVFVRGLNGRPESPEFGSVPDSPVVVKEKEKEEVSYGVTQAVRDQVVVGVKVLGNGLGQRVSSGFDMASPDSVSSDGSLTNPLSRRNPSVIYQDAATQTQYSNNNNNGVTNDKNTRIQMQQQQIHDSAYLMSTSTAAVTTTTQTDLQHPQVHQQHQFIQNGVTNDQNTRIQMQQQQIHDQNNGVTTQTNNSNNGVTNDQNTRIQMQQQQIHDSAYPMSTSTAAVTTTKTDLQHPQVHQQHQFIHTAVPPPQYIHHHPSGAVPMASYYPIYPPQSQHHVPVSALDQRKFVYYMPAISAPPNSQVPTPSSLFNTPRTVQPASKPESPVYRTNSSGASGPQLVQPQYVAYSHIQQPSQAVASSGGSGGNYAYEFADLSQQGQHLYYAAQPMPPQSAAQYQTMSSNLPVEGGSHIQTENTQNSMKQQVKKSQP